MTIIENLVETKIARSVRHATAIANGLHFADLHTDEERMARLLLYLAWRGVGTRSAAAFAHAIAGREPMTLTDRYQLWQQFREKRNELRRWQVLYRTTLPILITCRTNAKYCGEDMRAIKRRMKRGHDPRRPAAKPAGRPAH